MCHIWVWLTSIFPNSLIFMQYFWNMARCVSRELLRVSINALLQDFCFHANIKSAEIGNPVVDKSIMNSRLKDFIKAYIHSWKHESYRKLLKQIWKIFLPLLSRSIYIGVLFCACYKLTKINEGWKILWNWLWLHLPQRLWQQRFPRLQHSGGEGSQTCWKDTSEEKKLKRKSTRLTPYSLESPRARPTSRMRVMKK